MVLLAIDTTPKAPGYVKMVESQRDLLLRTVRELQQKSNLQAGTLPDVNTVLHELDIQVGDSEDTSCSLLQDSAGLQASSGTSPSPDHNLDPPCLDFTDLESFPWLDLTSMDTSSTTTAAAAHPEADRRSNRQGDPQGTRDPGLEYSQEEVFKTYPLDDNILPTQWASTIDDPYLGGDANLALSSFTDADEQQQQLWRNGDIEFLNKDIMQDSF